MNYPIEHKEGRMRGIWGIHPGWGLTAVRIAMALSLEKATLSFNSADVARGEGISLDKAGHS